MQKLYRIFYKNNEILARAVTLANHMKYLHENILCKIFNEIEANYNTCIHVQRRTHTPIY